MSLLPEPPFCPSSGKWKIFWPALYTIAGIRGVGTETWERLLKRAAKHTGTKAAGRKDIMFIDHRQCFSIWPVRMNSTPHPPSPQPLLCGSSIAPDQSVLMASHIQDPLGLERLKAVGIP